MPERDLDHHATTAVPADGRRGRGAASNTSSRYDRERRLAVDDGWGSLEAAEPLRTTVTPDRSRSILARNTSPDIPFDRSINPYRGCEHGCIYCFARPTHAFLGLSPGLDFESRLFVKPEAAALLRRELATPGYRCAVIAVGTNTDPYQPVERQHGIMRQVLEVLAACDHPVSIVTKSALVLRDLDILAPMAAKGLAKVALSITTLDRRLARSMEPRAATPERRLEVLRTLSRAGIPACVLIAPVIPGLNDDEIERILEAAATAGAAEAGCIPLRLPLEIRELFEEWLKEQQPNREQRVMKLLRSMHGGQVYRADFGRRMTGNGPFADLLQRRFRLAAGRLGLNQRRLAFDTTLFRPPADGRQLSLL